ncbi:MAG: bifunctional DNA-formamidopyrimidine glycosylase/DNA-(apurinic or apyrimidinic site) lyase [Candidatus Omnitrophica bacterium]|nr:bifunctional DNA-formamidopyrimidine glycosylase/DNA-(apurinic or apyrimidinic site) lyase [Candidatus Omnitrophota bacterium]
MPELPEVETIKRELVRAVCGKKIVEVLVYNPKVIRQPGRREFINGLRDVRIKRILRKGKLLLLELSSGKTLAIHLKMTGQLIYPGVGRDCRAAFKFSNGRYLDFRDQRLFGDLRLVDDWRDLKFIKELGPEPSGVSLDKFKTMIAARKTKIKPLLLDQTFISGIGNLYAAEALFRARIHPARAANSLSEKEQGLLFKEIQDTLTEAIRHKGSSVDQYVQVNGRSGSYVKYHKVYARRGKACLRCGGPIKRISLGGRGTYFCPKCQK